MIACSHPLLTFLPLNRSVSTTLVSRSPSNSVTSGKLSPTCTIRRRVVPELAPSRPSHRCTQAPGVAQAPELPPLDVDVCELTDIATSGHCMLRLSCPSLAAKADHTTQHVHTCLHACAWCICGITEPEYYGRPQPSDIWIAEWVCSAHKGGHIAH